LSLYITNIYIFVIYKAFHSGLHLHRTPIVKSPFSYFYKTNIFELLLLQYQGCPS